MPVRRPTPIALLGLVASLAPALPRPAAAQPRPATSTTSAASAPRAATLPPRGIRRDLSMTRSIQRAHAAGTRDSTGRPGPRYWQLAVDYDIAARLDPATATVTGRERVTLRNTSDSALRTIVLRLDQNIYAPNVPRAETVPEITEGMVVTALAVNGAAVDLSDRTGAAGRAARRADAPPTAPTASGMTQTVALVRLPTPIPAGGTATLDAEWRFRVPRADGVRGLRMGRWADTLFQVAQWYPRVAVYDDLRGWDTEPYLGPSEFHNNFGRFDVRLDLPAGWVVGATGELQNAADVLTPAARERLAGVLASDSTRPIVAADERGAGRATAAGPGTGANAGRLTWHFTADSVNDFAWAASDRFVWDATRATIPGRGAIPVHLLYLPGNTDEFRRAGPVVRHALEFYSRLWMPYAWRTFTMVDGPEGGMEYPTFIMSGLGAADHEVGHQWWPMMVGVNETWYGFMDEGFNQYMNALSSADLRGRPPVLDGVGQSYGRISGNETEAPLAWNANYGGPNYGFQAYGKAPMMLSMLGGIVGDSAVQRAMAEYARAWRFKKPSPWDFAFMMDRALGRDLGWFWHAWFNTTDAVDGAIDGVATRGRRTTVTVRQAGQMPAPVVLEVRLPATGPAVRPMANARLVDDTTAVVTWPVEVWFDGRRTFDAVLDFGGRVPTRITLDPARRFPDRDPSDNAWPRAERAERAERTPRAAMAAPARTP